MSDLAGIGCVLMRGGTSKGPFFLADDLPADVALRDRVLIAGLGSGHPLQIDGIGGGNPLSSKVAIISRSKRPGVDVDYLFAQVGVDKSFVDTSPNCGNMISGVGPFAIEAGLVEAGDPVTRVRIHNVNTSSEVEAEVRTPGGVVIYGGEAVIDGVPGGAAPVMLTFTDALARSHAELFPSGNVSETIDGIEVTCISSAMTMMILRAADVGVTGYESPQALDADNALMSRLEKMRLEAGLRMGLGDVSLKVIPKPVLLAPPRVGGNLCVRYFMPHSCHTALATTGAVGLGVAGIVEGSVVARMMEVGALPTTVMLEHPAGRIDLGMAVRAGRPVISLLRTARRLFEGHILVPRSLLADAGPGEPAVAESAGVAA